MGGVVLILIRLYRFKRRCGMPRRQAFAHALRAVLNDLHINKEPKL